MKWLILGIILGILSGCGNYRLYIGVEDFGDTQIHNVATEQGATKGRSGK